MPNIRHQLLIGARHQEIYDAITSNKGLSAWWTPDVDARPDLNSIARFGFGNGYFKEMRIIELEPSKKIKWLCVTGADEWVGTLISFELQPGDWEMLLNEHSELSDQVQQQQQSQDSTVLIFHHDDWKEYTPMFAECNYTWARFLRSLKLLCETGQGRPWPNQHTVAFKDQS
jgi:uncharacterized protein YndB with AHSA1/START domain